MQGLETKLTRILRRGDPGVYNRLLSLPDRTIALAAWSAGSAVGEELVQSVPGTKRDRVREERALLDRRHFRSTDAREALSEVVSHLSGRPGGGTSGYLRPSGRRR